MERMVEPNNCLCDGVVLLGPTPTEIRLKAEGSLDNVRHESGEKWACNVSSTGSTT